MQSKLYGFEILGATANGIFQARDPDNGETVLLYEWTPPLAERGRVKQQLAEQEGNLRVRVLTADASLYLVAVSPALAHDALARLRSAGLFTATWATESIPPKQVPPPAPPGPQPVPGPVIRVVPASKWRYVAFCGMGLLLGLAAGVLIGWGTAEPTVARTPVQIDDSFAVKRLTEENQKLRGVVAAGQDRAAREASQRATSEAAPEVSLALGNWRDALLSDDADRIANCYGDQVERYFLQKNVDRNFVRNDVQQRLSRGARITSLNLSSVSMTVTQGVADVSFYKNMTTDTAGTTLHVSSRSSLHLMQENGAWKIVFERDFKI